MEKERGVYLIFPPTTGDEVRELVERNGDGRYQIIIEEIKPGPVLRKGAVYMETRPALEEEFFAAIERENVKGIDITEFMKK